MANDDQEFFRSAIANINGKDVTVLVSKIYSKGQELDVEDEDNYRMAEEACLNPGGFYA